ncbi:MAG: hypothetical protein VX776_10195, partial [Planctomycetota bacterium]|nr:hypothetical protein [Planctomycetota bacterium]
LFVSGLVIMVGSLESSIFSCMSYSSKAHRQKLPKRALLVNEQRFFDARIGKPSSDFQNQKMVFHRLSAISIGGGDFEIDDLTC